MTASAALSELLALPEDFYAELVRRNRGLVTAVDQQRLRRASLLVAGCGSVGGAAVEPLVRLGAERLVLAEPGGYELSNLNRQRATLADLGANKAAVQARRATEINPFAHIEVVSDGITAAKVIAGGPPTAIVTRNGTPFRNAAAWCTPMPR